MYATELKGGGGGGGGEGKEGQGERVQCGGSDGDEGNAVHARVVRQGEEIGVCEAGDDALTTSDITRTASTGGCKQ